MGVSIGACAGNECSAFGDDSGKTAYALNGTRVIPLAVRPE